MILMIQQFGLEQKRNEKKKRIICLRSLKTACSLGKQGQKLRKGVEREEKGCGICPNQIARGT